MRLLDLWRFHGDAPATASCVEGKLNSPAGPSVIGFALPAFAGVAAIAFL
jgi:hypothetical protein